MLTDYRGNRLFIKLDGIRTLSEIANEGSAFNVAEAEITRGHDGYRALGDAETRVKVRGDKRRPNSISGVY